MKNKNLVLKLGILSMVIGCFGLSFTSATKFRLDLSNNSKVIESLSKTYLSSNIIPIHFADNGNDFGGFLYFSNGLAEDTEGESVTNLDSIRTVSIMNGNKYDTYECDRQVKGFYYNAERGERLRPLDQDTWSEAGIDTTGGFYTMCNKSGYVNELKKCLNNATQSENTQDYNSCKDNVRVDFKTDGDGYYGYIKHTYSGQDMVLIAGVNYNTGTKFISIESGEGFSPSFVRIGNKYPVGFVYDYNGGVGLVGCKVTPHGQMKNIVGKYNEYKNISGLDSLFGLSGGYLKYKLNTTDVDCSNAVWDPLIGVVIEGVVGMGEKGNKNKFGVIGNQMNEKMQYFTSADINNNTIINYARKKAELLCRGKWQNTTHVDLCSSSVICIKDNNVEANLCGNSSSNNATLIVKNGNVRIKPFENKKESPLKYYDIFIDSGNLIINEDENTKQFVFGENGFIYSENTGAFTSAVDSAKTNNTVYEGGSGVAIGSFIRGNFIVNGKFASVGGSGLQHKYFIHGKISTRDDFDTLLDTFKWRCNYGNATDGTYCPKSSDGWKNPYDNASLVIIDQNYKSPFFNN